MDLGSNSTSAAKKLYDPGQVTSPQFPFPHLNNGDDSFLAGVL